MYKLIRELNEQALTILYNNPMQNVVREGGSAEYLVI